MISRIVVFVLAMLPYLCVAEGELYIFLEDQSFEYIVNDEVVRVGPISTGTRKHPTPTGEFEILLKDKNKRSKKYNGIPMPYAMQVDGDIFVHQGKLPGYPASHGCVRLRREDAKYLFENMTIGDKVVIAQ